MGAQFDLSHINLVGYLTDETGLAAPRSDLDTIGKFLMSLAYRQNLISSTQGSPDDWTRQVAGAAQDQFNWLNFQFGELGNDRPVDSRRYLDPLRTYSRDTTSMRSFSPPTTMAATTPPCASSGRPVSARARTDWFSFPRSRTNPASYSSSILFRRCGFWRTNPSHRPASSSGRG